MKTTLTQEFLRMPAATLGNAATLPPIYKEKLLTVHLERVIKDPLLKREGVFDFGRALFKKPRRVHEFVFQKGTVGR